MEVVDLKRKIGRMLPVRRPEMVHRSPVDYDRRENARVVEKELFEGDESESDEEEDMKDYTLVKRMAEEICDYFVAKDVYAGRVTDTEPPVVELYGIDEEIIRITVDTE